MTLPCYGVLVIVVAIAVTITCAINTLAAIGYGLHRGWGLVVLT